MSNDQQWKDLVSFLREKENIGIINIRFIRPKPGLRGGGEPCGVFTVLAGYYHRLIMSEVQRAEPEMVRIDHDTTPGPLHDGVEVRVRVYF